jgi:hypothetical protein
MVIPYSDHADQSDEADPTEGVADVWVQLRTGFDGYVGDE